jgi:hypothetical protein
LEPDKNKKAEDWVEWNFDAIMAKKSKICRLDSECYDVEISFYDPDNTHRARKIYACTVDVSDVVPVMIEEERIFNRR